MGIAISVYQTLFRIVSRLSALSSSARRMALLTLALVIERKSIGLGYCIKLISVKSTNRGAGKNVLQKTSILVFIKSAELFRLFNVGIILALPSWPQFQAHLTTRHRPREPQLTISWIQRQYPRFKTLLIILSFLFRVQQQLAQAFSIQATIHTLLNRRVNLIMVLQLLVKFRLDWTQGCTQKINF